jgi:antitoxin (DNA-binding transcriptional repressor) of toxin-antitoxin stability system
MRTKTTRRTIAATEAAKTFGSLIDRVRESGAVYQVESRGQVVAEIAPPRKRFTVADFQNFLAHGPRAPEELLASIEHVREELRREKPDPVKPLSGRGGRRRRS